MKNILLHSIPVAVLSLAAIFGLTTEEQNVLTQDLTTVISMIFAMIPIIMHVISRNKMKTVEAKKPTVPQVQAPAPVKPAQTEAIAPTPTQSSPETTQAPARAPSAEQAQQAPPVTATKAQ